MDHLLNILSGMVLIVLWMIVLGTLANLFGC